MARTLDATLETAIAEAGTAPGWLISIATATPLRYSTRGTLTYGGHTYTGGATLSGVGESGLLSEARLGLPNADNAASALALTDLLRDVEVTVSAYYDVAGTGYAETLGTLAIDAVEAITPTRVSFVLATPAQAASHQPAVLLGPPLCRHIPAPGTTITWGGTTITIED
jgi:hypothetical protein